MPKWMTSFFVFFLSTTLFTAKAKSTELIIHNHIHAMGGVQTLQKMKQLCLEGKVSLSNGKIIKESIFPDESRSSISNGQFKYFRHYEILDNTETTGTLRSGKGSEKNGSQQETSCFLTDLALESNIGNIEMVNQEYLNGIKCYKLKLRLNAAVEVNYYINSQNWYIIREARHYLRHNSSQATNKDIIINYSNYREVDGLVFPQLTEICSGFQVLSEK